MRRLNPLGGALWKCGQRKRVAHSPTGVQNQKKRTFDVLPKPDKLIRYRQAMATSPLGEGDVKSFVSGRECWNSLRFVFVGEDGEEDAVHGGSNLEDAHGAGSAADLAKAAFDGVGGSHRLALDEGLVAKAGQKPRRDRRADRRRRQSRLGPSARRSGGRPSAPSSPCRRS